VQFHPEHAPTAKLLGLIDAEMKLVDKDFRTILGHWRSLKSKVGRQLDLMIQFRVLDQQDLAVKQRDLAVAQQNIAVSEAKTSQTQSRYMIVFTAITVVFLPLSFLTSYFGMNVSDFLGGKYNSLYFWAISGPLSTGIILTVFVAARYGAGEKSDVETGLSISDRPIWQKLKAKNKSRWLRTAFRTLKLKVT
jgi:hypothetical protein